MVGSFHNHLLRKSCIKKFMNMTWKFYNFNIWFELMAHSWDLHLVMFDRHFVMFGVRLWRFSSCDLVWIVLCECRAVALHLKYFHYWICPVEKSFLYVLLVFCECCALALHTKYCHGRFCWVPYVLEWVVFCEYCGLVLHLKYFHRCLCPVTAFCVLRVLC